MQEFEAVIGLEVHAQLLTKTKLFCGCATTFGSSTNANVCAVCSGQPGSLPSLNAKAVEFAAKAGLALGCTVRMRSQFARKNYFYPDLPKGYQISQYDAPICEGGELTIELGEDSIKKVQIQRIHLEEDAGKSVHSHGYSLVNLNRAATPLIEIVSHPDLRSAHEAGAYLRKLRAVLMYLDVCDGNMQEGSFRCDANVSVRPVGTQTFGTRVEIKNVNSFRFVEKAIDYEINRQIQLILSGGKVAQETRLYDSARNTTASMRSKEEAQDYRYFPDPDLPDVVVNEAQLKLWRESLAELPDQKKERFERDFGLSAYDAAMITSSRKLATFFEDAVRAVHKPGGAKSVANYVMGELLRLLKADDIDMDDFKFDPAHLGEIVNLIQDGVISNSVGKTVFEDCYRTGQSPRSIIDAKGLAQVSDSKTIEAVIDAVIQKNPAQVAEYRGGKEKVFGFFVGQVMKLMGGRSNPGVVNEILKRKLMESK